MVYEPFRSDPMVQKCKREYHGKKSVSGGLLLQMFPVLPAPEVKIQARPFLVEFCRAV